MQPQEEYCIDSAGGAELEFGSHDGNLDLGGEGDEEDEERGRADEEEEEEERANEHDGRTFEEILIVDIDLVVDFATANTKSNSVTSSYSVLNALQRVANAKRMHTEGKEDELKKESNVADVGGINKCNDVLPFLPLQ